MRKLVLASNSKARRDLLHQIGLKFSATGSSAREETVLGCGTPAEFVKRNALKKARYVAARTKSGVIIGADTVVIVGRRIIGKPKSIADAVRSLKILTRSPQWVYTGIAVIDIDKKKSYTAYEKTKVYMYPLSGSQIRKYFKKISPYDKAGSFDVRGPGSIFIDRIEGCFYNVVGLPLAKLAVLLKKTGIEVF